MTTPQGVLELLSTSGMARGRALYAMQRAKSSGRPALRSLASEITRRPARDLPKVPQHPSQVASREVYRRNSEEDLTAVELAWLQRLPLDAEKVSFDDAARLAALAGSISATKAPASARLVASVWEPVRAVHDQRQATARLEQAKVSLPGVPASAQDALVEALAEQHEGLSEEALRAEAQGQLQTWVQRRQRDHDEALSRASDAVVEVEQRIARMGDSTGSAA